MAQTKHFLGLYPSVGDYTDYGRHKDRDNSLNGVEPVDFVTKPGTGEVYTKRGQVSSPDCELQKVHGSQFCFDC